MPRGTSGTGIVGNMSPNRPAAASRGGRAKGGRGVRCPGGLLGQGPAKADAPGHRNADNLSAERLGVQRRAGFQGTIFPMPDCSKKR